MAKLRAALAAVAESEGLQLVAAGTHPYGAWHDQLITDQDRYEHNVHRRRLERCGQRATLGPAFPALERDPAPTHDGFCNRPGPSTTSARSWRRFVSLCVRCDLTRA